MIVEWSPAASAEFAAIERYIGERNPAAADRVSADILDAAASLALFPRRGRHSRTKGLRELVIARRPYFLLYRTSKTTVTILRVVHASRQWPPPSDA